jgi:putative hydrolase of the HAD superfamily
MPIRALLFDWEGTLVHSAPVAVAAACELVTARLFASHSLAADPVSLERSLRRAFAGGLPGGATAAALLADALAEQGLHPLRDALDSASAALAEGLTAGQQLFDDARALLPSLRYRGYAIAVVTNAFFPGEQLAARIAALGLAGCFDAVVSSVDAGAAKPHPASCRLALETLGVAASDALLVGDRLETDIAAALAAGSAAALIDRANRRRPPAGVHHLTHLAGVNRILGERMP